MVMSNIINQNTSILEKMMVFMHNSFPVEFSVAPNALFLYKYVELLRTHALGNFKTFIKELSKDGAMLKYLNGHYNIKNSPDENYARELLELFCFGVDNGYDQSDITEMSKAWAGWRVRIVHPTNTFDIFAPESRTTLDGSTNDFNITNLYGVYAFNYQSNFHRNGLKTIFPGKTVPARFGPPWTGANYQLTLNNGNSNSTNTLIACCMAPAASGIMAAVAGYLAYQWDPQHAVTHTGIMAGLVSGLGALLGAIVFWLITGLYFTGMWYLLWVIQYWVGAWRSDPYCAVYHDYAYPNMSIFYSVALLTFVVAFALARSRCCCRSRRRACSLGFRGPSSDCRGEAP